MLTIVDNLSRRNIDNELETSSLDTDLARWASASPTWKKFSWKRHCEFYNFNVAENYHRLLTLISNWKPDADCTFC